MVTQIPRERLIHAGKGITFCRTQKIGKDAEQWLQQTCGAAIASAQEAPCKPWWNVVLCLDDNVPFCPR